MASDYDPPELQSLRHLEYLVRQLGDELAMFRRRAQQAEVQLRAFESSTKSGDLFAEQRVAQLEKENAELRARLNAASSRTRGVLEQVRFLRQQAARPVHGNGADR